MYKKENTPFSTKDIKITNASMTLFSLLNRLKYDEIDLSPSFRKDTPLWNKKKMSRFIESILLKLPLPILYFDVENPDKWVVVDGVQRLSALKAFIYGDENTHKLRLTDLEFLTHLEGKTYEELERPLKRIIDATEVITYQIEAQTPKEVRYAIYKRINAGRIK